MRFVQIVFVLCNVFAWKAYIEGTLDAWTDAALVMIKRTLEAFAVSSGVVSGSRTSDRVRSLASAVASKDCSPANRTEKGTGLTLRNQDRSSVLRRVFARSVASVSLGRGDGENSVRRRGHDDVEGDEQVKRERGGEDEASDLEAKTTLDDIMDSQSRVAEGRHLPARPRPGEKGLEGEEAGVTQASLPDLVRDAQEEEQNGSGDETGRRLGQEGEGNVMSALLATSGEVVAAVETHQKVSNIKKSCPPVLNPQGFMLPWDRTLHTQTSTVRCIGTLWLCSLPILPLTQNRSIYFEAASFHIACLPALPFLSVPLSRMLPISPLICLFSEHGSSPAGEVCGSFEATTELDVPGRGRPCGPNLHGLHVQTQVPHDVVSHSFSI